MTRFIDKDKHVLELYLTEPDGQELMALQITYTRKAPSREK